MFHFKVNDKGTRVPHFFSGSLIDFVEPELEGQAWAKEVSERFPPQAASVLGVGGGHHLEALLQKGWTLPLTVFETSPILVEEFTRRFQFANVKIVCFASPRHSGSVTELAEVRELIRGLQLCLPFRRAWTHDLAFFAELFAALTLRSQESCMQWLLERGHGVSSQERWSQIEWSRATVKDVHECVEFSSLKEQLIQACLVEMIK